MSVCLAICAGGGNAHPVEAVRSALTLIDTFVILFDDTVADDMRAEVEKATGDVPGVTVDRPFEGSERSFNFMLDLAAGTADWILHMHSDEQADVFPTMKEWLSDDPSPHTDAWMVPIVNPGLTHRLPRLLRGDREWRYVGDAHEYLEVDHTRTRWLNGLSLTHGGWSDPSKFEWVIEQLAEGVAAGEPRATFYTAEALRDLGRTEEAIEQYERRSGMGGWEEERWYAEYQAAKLSEDVERLLFVHHKRPHRHEPLQAAARIVAVRGTDDVLFLETLA